MNMIMKNSIIKKYEYIVVYDDKMIGNELIQELWKNDYILEMNVQCNVGEMHRRIQIEFDFNKGLISNYKVYDVMANDWVCKLKFERDGFYRDEKKLYWRSSSCFITYELAKYKLPLCMKYCKGGFIAYYDIIKKDLMFLSIRKNADNGYQFLAPEYSEVTYKDSTLTRYFGQSLQIIRKKGDIQTEYCI